MATRQALTERKPDDLVNALATLEATNLGNQVMALVTTAQDLFLAACRRDNDAKRRFRFPAPWSADERAAEAIIDHFGPPEDCWFLRQIAERQVEVDRDLERESA